VIGIPFQAFYSAGKFALEGLGEALAYEVAPFGMHVTLVEPGNVKTDFTASRRTVRAADGDPVYGAALARAVGLMERDEADGVSLTVAPAWGWPGPIADGCLSSWPVQESASPGIAGQPNTSGRSERQRQYASRRNHACVIDQDAHNSDGLSRCVAGAGHGSSARSNARLGPWRVRVQSAGRRAQVALAMSHGRCSSGRTRLGSTWCRCWPCCRAGAMCRTS
jgi:short chain dehydrogenase